MRKYLVSLLAPLLLVILGWIWGCKANFGNLPRDLEESDLVGVWEASYGRNRTDRLIIKEDGTYKQTFEDRETNYAFETDWNPWRLEELPDGRVYIHFDEGRYYPAGVRIAELDGMGDPCPTNLPDCISGNNPRPFYDPYTKDSIEMLKQLVLTIRVDSRGEPFFHHMWTSTDRGFALLGGRTDVYRRIDDHIPVEN